MDISNQEEEMPMPINSTYGGGYGHGHLVHHDHRASQNPISTSSAPQMPSSGCPLLSNFDDHNGPYKKVVKYKECLKNHAAVMGGNATDGCGEFMPSGEEGTIEAFTCSACNCHRNFHRKEVEGEEQSSYDLYRLGKKVILGHHKNILGHHHDQSLVHPSRTPVHSRGGHAAAPHLMIMPYSFGSLPSESDEQEGGAVVARPPPQLVKRRFRTKFTEEQKEKMFNFAENVGWKIQKQEAAVVQQFCQDIGVERRVLKVWMHNNKHNLAKKNNLPNA